MMCFGNSSDKDKLSRLTFMTKKFYTKFIKTIEIQATLQHQIERVGENGEGGETHC